MKFNLITNYKDALPDEKPWKEFYENDVENPEKWGQYIIDNFNKTLRPHERARVYLGIEVIGDEENKELHRWEKMTSGMSINFRGRNCDLMYCRKCGITGKRYGLSSKVVIDSKFRKKAFQRCNTAVEEMKGE